MSSKNILLKLVIIIFLIVIAFFTLAFAVTNDSVSSTEPLDTYNLEFNQTQTAVIIQQDNLWWGAYWRIPNTYILEFTSNKPCNVGLVIVDMLYEEDIDNSFETGHFYTFDEMQNFLGSNVMKFSLNPESTINQTVDYQNGVEYFDIVLFVFDLQQPLSIQLDTSVMIRSELPFPEMTYTVMIIMLIAIAFFLTPSEENTNKLKSLLRKHGIDAVVGIMIVYSYITQYFLESIYLYFCQILLLFFAIHKANVMETMLRMKMNKAQRILASTYITSLLIFGTALNYHLNVAPDVRAAQFILYTMIDTFQPLFWVILFLSINKKIAQLQVDTTDIKMRMSRWLVAAGTIAVFEVSFQFFTIMISVLENYLTMDLGNFVFDLIQYGWTLYFIVQGLKKLRGKKSKNSWIGIFKLPDLQEIILGMKSEKNLIILAYGTYKIFQNMLLVPFVTDRTSSLYSNFISMIMYVIVTITSLIAWSLSMRLIQDEDREVKRAIHYSFILVAFSLEIINLAFLYLFFFVGNTDLALLVNGISQGVILVLGIMIYNRNLHKTEPRDELSFSKGSILLIGAPMLLNFIIFPFYIEVLLVIGPYFLIPGYLIVISGKILNNMVVKDDQLYVNPTKVLVILLSMIGFAFYYLFDSENLWIAISAFGSMVLVYLIAMNIQTNQVMVSEDKESLVFDLSQFSVNLRDIGLIVIFYFIYFAAYIQRGADMGIDAPYDYAYLVIGEFIWIIGLLFYFKTVLHDPSIKVDTRKQRSSTLSGDKSGSQSQATQITNQRSQAVQSHPQQTTTKSQRKQFCTKCGNKLREDQKFCNKCGTAI